MNIRRDICISMIVLTGFSFSPAESQGQVDPDWLRSWNEAQETRPEKLTANSRIAPGDEPGIPFIIHGQIFLPDGRTPAPDVVVHSYHRDHRGYEFGPNDNSVTTWKLQGWVITNSKGQFVFQTIRPASDHLGREGAHIHFTLVSTDFGRQWAPKVHLLDDPLVNDGQLKRSEAAGKFAWVRKVKTKNGIQHIDVNFQLKEKSDF